MPKKEIPHLLIVVDIGASAIKIIASLNGNKTCLPMVIDPYCARISTPLPPCLNFDEKSLWIKVSGARYAIGAIAKNLSITPEDPSTNFVAKICGAVALAHQKLGLSHEFKLSLFSFLPALPLTCADDWKEKMIAALKLALGSIITPAGVFNPHLEHFDFFHEGCGVMNWHRTVGIARKKNISIIMLGFLNTSILAYYDEKITNFSSQYGFLYLLEEIFGMTGGIYPISTFAKPVWKYLMRKDDSSLARVSQGSKNEIDRFKEAIDLASINYFVNLRNWLESILEPTEVIALCGGNCDFVRDEIHGILQKYVNELVVVGSPVFEHIGAVHIPIELINTRMPYRYLDAYCLWLLLVKIVKENEI
jgi:hypothetical protein